MRGRLVLAALLLAGAVQAQTLKWVTFACEPRDAQVFLEVGGTAPYLLGPCNRALPLDQALFQGRQTVTLTFRRPGWLDETRLLPQAFFTQRDRYPDAAQGPVRLSPAGDASSRATQAAYYLRTEWLPLTAAALVVSAVWLRSRRRLAVLERAHERVQELDSLRADGADPLLLKVVGGYRLVERLGAGAVGSVYRAVPDTSLNTHEAVAIKVMHAQFAADPEHRRRFQREVEVSRELSHPGIVRLYDYGEQDGLFYLVLELLRGCSLREIIRGRQLSLSEALQFARPLAASVDYAHQKRVMHRDLKPDNVFVCDDGRLVVMDFGLARGDQFTQYTATGVGLGTPAYMAPEQVEGRAECASDRYAFGVILFEMLAGEVPFQAPDPVAVAYMHVGRQPPSLADFRPDLPAAVGDVVARLLAKVPDQRFATLEEAMGSL